MLGGQNRPRIDPMATADNHFKMFSQPQSRGVRLVIKQHQGVPLCLSSISRCSIHFRRTFWWTPQRQSLLLHAPCSILCCVPWPHAPLLAPLTRSVGDACLDFHQSTDTRFIAGDCLSGRFSNKGKYLFVRNYPDCEDRQMDEITIMHYCQE